MIRKQNLSCLDLHNILRCDLSGLLVNFGESQITLSLKLRDLVSHSTNFSTLIILLLYVEVHIFILETLEKLEIYYRIMIVLLLFMHLLVVD